MKPAWGLRGKVLFASLCLIGVLLTALALLLAQERRSRGDVLRLSRDSQSQLIHDIARSHAVSVATQLADALTNDLYYFDLQSIGEQLAFARNLPPTTSAIVYNTDGEVIHDGSREISTYGTSIDTPLVRDALAGDDAQVRVDKNTVEAARRIRIGDQALGGVLVRFDLTDLESAIAAGNVELSERLDQSTRWRVGSIALFVAALTVLALLSSWIIQRSIVRPILRLASAARQMESGDYRVRLDRGRHDEIGELERSFDRMSERVAESQRTAEQRANVDKLTGLPNRRAFDETIAARAAGGPDDADAFGLMFIDVDNLKQINDRHGHDAGDAALIDFAHRALRVLDRESAGTAWLARIGGDEFAVLCTGRPIVAAAMHLAEAVLSLFDAPTGADSGHDGLSVSIGIALYPVHATSATDLLRVADTAMYQAKHAGKRRIHFHQPGPT